MYEYGVTMEIFETNLRNNMLHIKARGRQRCKRLADSKMENVAGESSLMCETGNLFNSVIREN